MPRKNEKSPRDYPSDASLIAELLDRHAAALELYAAQWTATPADCVQEAYIRLASELQRAGSPPKHPAAWLYKTVRNQALNSARAQRRRQHHEQIAARLTERQHSSKLDLTEKLPLPLSEVVEALDTLPHADRELVVLRIWSELTWQEIADLTDTSSSSAQRRYVAVLTKLRQHLEPSCPPNPTCPPN